MKKTGKIEDLDCAHCAGKIEKAVSKINGVNDCKVSFLAEKIVLDMDDNADYEEIKKQIIKICNDVEPDCTATL